MQPSNIPSIVVTFDTSKLFKFNVIKEVQELNILLIASQFPVLKLSIFKLLKLVHP